MEFTAEAIRRAERVRLIIFDVDGVLTDGGIYIGPEGELFKPFFCRDGLGITLAHRAGSRRPSSRDASRSTCATAPRSSTSRRSTRAISTSARPTRTSRQSSLADEELAYFGDDLVDLPSWGRSVSPLLSPTPCRKCVRWPSCSRTIRVGTVPCASSSSSSSRRSRWEDLVASFQAKKSMEGLAQ